MTPDSSDQAQSEAIAQLESLGLSAYAARTFVGLVSLGEGTAEDISEVVEVPRTRVYDAAEELRERGLVDVQQSSPKQFWAISAETAARQFEREYTQRLNTLVDALDDLEAPTQSEQQRGVWTVTGRESVTDRVVEFVEAADEEVVFMTVGDLLTDAVVEALRGASDRGVPVRLGGLSDAVQAEIRDEVPAADPFETLWDWTDTPAGRVLMTDRETTLASVLVEGDDGPPEPRDETAIWGSGPNNSLVVVLKAIFTWQLDEVD